jgi:hypothetical protein
MRLIPGCYPSARSIDTAAAHGGPSPDLGHHTREDIIMKKYLRILALMAGLLLTAAACGDQDATGTVTRPTTPASVDLTDGECHISAAEVANWPETSARLPRACDGPATSTHLTDGECHLSADEVANWPETSARLPRTCAE